MVYYLSGKEPYLGSSRGNTADGDSRAILKGSTWKGTERHQKAALHSHAFPPWKFA